MTSSQWKWTTGGAPGIWRHGAPWLRPLSAAAPYLTVMLLVLTLHIAGGAMTSAKGVLFDLPDAAPADGAATELVALLMPREHETLVIFDDSRYVMDDESSMRALCENFSARAEKSASKTLLALADRRVQGGDLMKFAAAAKRSGIAKILFACRNGDKTE